MRITVRLSDGLGEDLKRRTDNVSRYVEEALTEKIQREERRRARQEILDMAEGESIDPALHDQNQKMRRDEGRHGTGLPHGGDALITHR
jgi:post-segregation antitoxin (ccd killing protein)